MNESTPLDEVAAHLPKEAAEYLIDQPLFIQAAALAQLRFVVAYWETSGVTLDPIAYEIVVTSVVALAVAHAQGRNPEYLPQE